jgi:hypothetical protein
MGSPLRTVGVINADVSTCVAGWLDRKPDMLPVNMTVNCSPNDLPKTFHVQVARQRSLLASLVYSALTNSVDMEGELPEELTAELEARLEVEGQTPLVVKDTYSGSGYSGGRAPQALYNQVASLVNLLNYNSYKPVRINRIDCITKILPGRRTADIDAVELDSDSYAPGDTVKATVYLRPYKGTTQRRTVSLKLPADLPEGSYSATVCDDLTNSRYELRDNPVLSNPHDLEQVFASVRVQTAAKRTNLVLRVPVTSVGVVLDGKALPDLPPSMVQILGNSRRTGAQALSSALVAREPTAWVLQGSEAVHFTVTRHKKSIITEE